MGAYRRRRASLRTDLGLRSCVSSGRSLGISMGLDHHRLARLLINLGVLEPIGYMQYQEATPGSEGSIMS